MSHKDRERAVMQFVGEVWEACAALKKTPATNITAIGRAMTQVAVSVNDVLCEMEKIKPGSSDPTDEVPDDASSKRDNGCNDDETSSFSDLGNGLSPEEMKVAESTTGVVSDTLVIIKELIRAITGLLKMEKPDDTGDFVNPLENLLKLCQLEYRLMNSVPATKRGFGYEGSFREISSVIDEMQKVVDNFSTSAKGFLWACNGFRSSMNQMISKLDYSGTTDLEAKVQNLAVGN